MGGKLVVRLGAMGDILHTLPAATALGDVTWIVKQRWLPLLEGAPHIRAITEWQGGFEVAYDFQGLIKTAVRSRTCARRVIGFSTPRESLARWFYSTKVERRGAHVVDHNLALAGSDAPAKWVLPEGRPEGKLPSGRFVLASPAAGWLGKEWPRDHWARLRALLPIPLVLNGPPGSGLDHESSIHGLIDATRRAFAVVGVDSGPLHLAAALSKPGVAIFGPTDPARNGPYGGAIQVLRDLHAVTTYKRENAVAPSMRAITAEMVLEKLKPLL